MVWHLDVGSSPPGAGEGPKGWAVRPVSYTHLLTPWLGRRAFGVCQDWIGGEAVSYTHLDVYKRQHVHR